MVLAIERSKVQALCALDYIKQANCSSLQLIKLNCLLSTRCGVISFTYSKTTRTRVLQSVNSFSSLNAETRAENDVTVMQMRQN